jgi:hypothetical protein
MSERSPVRLRETFTKNDRYDIMRLNRSDCEPTSIYLETLATLERGQEPTLQQLLALRNDDPVVAFAVDQAVAAELQFLQLLILMHQAHRREPQ